MYDLLIRNGTLVDGTGSPRRRADVGVVGSRVVAVGPSLLEGAAREIDAEGAIVTPGWVDMHTHFDAQATWDPYCSPSGWHGVTTLVMGNCGVGFAPCRPSSRDWLIQVMEGVEDIPGSALSEGIQWEWESFPEYLDALQRRPFALDVATQVPHAALRAYVMGEERSERDDPTPDEIARMRDLVAEALEAGALGFSTSRTSLHKTSRGVLVAGTHAPREELLGIGEALRRTGKGVFECASEHVTVPEEFSWYRELAERVQRPVVFNLSQCDDHPELWRHVLDLLDACEADDVPVYAQCAGRAIGICMTFQGTAHPFAAYPSWLAMLHDPWEEKRAKLLDPAWQAKLLAEEPYPVWDFAEMVTKRFDKMFPLRDGNSYEPAASESIAAVAERTGQSPQAVALQWLLEDDGNGMIYFPLFNYSEGNLSLLHELHRHPRTRMGLSDGGAHCGAVCDAGMPSFMLSFWTRDRTRGPTLPLEHVVMRQTGQTAAFYGLHDRGVIAPGYLADLNVIDYDALELGRPEIVYDLPAGGRRLLQAATGYRYTIKSGQITYADGEATGAMAGGLLRGAQPAPA